MEENRENQELEQVTETPQEGYVPRPAWQVWAARIGVVIVIVAFLLYCYQIAMGGR